ncbi:unnamed protein product [Cylicocyclus nassatus]|uniref:DnaB/C C-terminal domain-containing protein n=1 Tax=Cylicocyclus nassatus TaxID=53992 RepID=A0AA36GQI9_CYLNA|nr:unnamed protein product [Cylicocyclus nassatus]
MVIQAKELNTSELYYKIPQAFNYPPYDKLSLRAEKLYGVILWRLRGSIKNGFVDDLALSPKQIGELEDFMEIDGLEKSLIEKAIDITAGETGSKRKYNYLKGILTNWKNGNIKTVADHEANEAERRNGKKNSYIDEEEAKRMQEKYGF